jgi:hypothetical protein
MPAVQSLEVDAIYLLMFTTTERDFVNRIEFACDIVDDFPPIWPICGYLCRN